MLTWLTPELLKFGTPLGLVLILITFGFIFATRIVNRLLLGYERVLKESAEAQRIQATASLAVAEQLMSMGIKVDNLGQKVHNCHYSRHPADDPKEKDDAT